MKRKLEVIYIYKATCALFRQIYYFGDSGYLRRYVKTCKIVIYVDVQIMNRY